MDKIDWKWLTIAVAWIVVAVCNIFGNVSELTFIAPALVTLFMLIIVEM
jgi:hypothetical protein